MLHLKIKIGKLFLNLVFIKYAKNVFFYDDRFINNIDNKILKYNFMHKE